MTDDATTPCVVCHRPHDRAGYACGHCRNRIDDDLAAILELTALAAASVTPTAKAGEGGSGKPGSRPPIDLGALDDALGIDALAVLETWERAFREDFGLTAYGIATEVYGATLSRTVGFLRHWLDRITESHPACDEFAREVRDLHRALRRHDGTVERGTMRIPCPAPARDDDAGECGYGLHVSPADLGAPVVCRRCGEQWNADRLLLVALSTPGFVLWVDQGTICEYLNIKERDLRRAAEAGAIKRKESRYELTSVIEWKSGAA